ncbi:diadenylate cyclase [Paenibacillus doosanensis]|uniref:tetratricopeptide repeat protein n=1 Tax=Paenibacillus doosanensis TaxID=1229154 RepID=UPI00217FAD31|nr:diadenylate cyclase [Paenibacillus doosanensis]MCS7461742.1 diadenylate cyclase [Paenibacillus doosanensis]
MSLELIEDIHKAVYHQLEEIVRKLDDRLELKLYAITCQEESSSRAAARIKRVLTGSRDEETRVMLENLTGPDEVLTKLGLADLPWDDSVEQLNRSITEKSRNRKPAADAAAEYPAVDSTEDSALEDFIGKTQPVAVPASIQGSIKSILYPNQLNLTLQGKPFDLVYILSIDYAGPQVYDMFYEMPQFSFLRMVLDYYFADYYKEDADGRLGEELESKYKENEVGFLQRMARVFLGKIQQYITEGNEADSEYSLGGYQEPNQQYYVNMLMEKIEGIATRTYEGESPFGCMLLMSSELLSTRTGLVNYAIQFDGEQGIALEDGHRIRKLLEMTNNERDLFLIADEQTIYGIGEVDWSLLGTDSVFKLEFKGLSRYDLMLITLQKEAATDKRVEADEDKKLFKMTTNLRIVSTKLLGVSFKNPEIGRDRFDPDLFKRIASAVFADDTTIQEKNLDKLCKLIKEATRQQSGTMVVIAKPDTAEAEVRRLKKQSTPIIKTQLNPAFIKHLTAIDGALYCDTDASCHAIGVILDGLAQEHIGDASRGARFNSAHRYLEKLKLEPTPCVIVIISEDGMVNLIPEPITERTARKVVKEYVDYIKETEKEKIAEGKVKSFEERLAQAGRTVEIDDENYFLLGDTWFKKGNYKKSAEYYEKVLDHSEKPYIYYRRLLVRSYLNYCYEAVGKEQVQIAQKFLDITEYIIANGSKEINYNDYNRRAIALHVNGDISEDSKMKDDYYKKALEDYNQSMRLKASQKNILFANRARLYASMTRYEEAIDDFISAMFEKNLDSYNEELMVVASFSPELLIYALTRYAERKGEGWGETELGKQLVEKGKQWESKHPEVAAALQQLVTGNSISPDSE